MSVHRTKDGRWYAAYYLPGEKYQKRKYFGRGPENRLAAESFDLDFRRQKARGAILPEARNPGPTFLELAQRYLIEHQLAAGSRRDIAWNLNAWVADLFGQKPVSELTMSDLADLNARMVARSKSPATRNRLRSYCRAVCQWGVHNEIIPDNPFARFRPDRKREGQAPPLITEAELRAVWQSAATHLQWAITCMLNLGVRPGPSELLGLRRADVDFDRRGVWVARGKTYSRRALVPVNDDFLEALADLFRREPTREFLIEYRGRPVDSLKTAWYAALRRAGIYQTAHRHGRIKHARVSDQTRRLRLYDLRHLFATLLLSGGADVKAASKILGHASPDLTLRTYYHLVDDQLRDAVSCLRLPSLPSDPTVPAEATDPDTYTDT